MYNKHNSPISRYKIALSVLTCRKNQINHELKFSHVFRIKIDELILNESCQPEKEKKNSLIIF